MVGVDVTKQMEIAAHYGMRADFSWFIAQPVRGRRAQREVEASRYLSGSHVLSDVPSRS